jgi:short-subunit dehydrogenase
MGPYNASKAAVISISETLHTELAAHDVQVSALCPTFFKTNLLHSLRAPAARQRDLAQASFEQSRISATEVARAGLSGLEKGQLIIIPQFDGRLVWWLKRLSPSSYFALLRFQQRRDLLGRWLARREARRARQARTNPAE